MVNPFSVLERVLFVPAAESTGLSEDKVSFLYCSNIAMILYCKQIRYVFLLFVAILLGFCMKHGLHPSRVNNTARHCYSFVCGMIFGLACFGFVYVCASLRAVYRLTVCNLCSQMMYLFAVVGICYAFLLILPPKVVHR